MLTYHKGNIIDIDSSDGSEACLNSDFSLKEFII